MYNVKARYFQLCTEEIKNFIRLFDVNYPKCLVTENLRVGKQLLLYTLILINSFEQIDAAFIIILITYIDVLYKYMRNGTYINIMTLKT